MNIKLRTYVYLGKSLIMKYVLTTNDRILVKYNVLRSQPSIPKGFKKFEYLPCFPNRYDDVANVAHDVPLRYAKKHSHRKVSAYNRVCLRHDIPEFFLLLSVDERGQQALDIFSYKNGYEASHYAID